MTKDTLLVKQNEITVKQAIELLSGLQVDPNTVTVIKYYGQGLTSSLFKALQFLEEKTADDIIQIIQVYKPDNEINQKFCPLDRIETLFSSSIQAKWLIEAHKYQSLIDREIFAELFEDEFYNDTDNSKAHFIKFMELYFKKDSERLKRFHEFFKSKKQQAI